MDWIYNEQVTGYQKLAFKRGGGPFHVVHTVDSFPVSHRIFIDEWVNIPISEINGL